MAPASAYGLETQRRKRTVANSDAEPEDQQPVDLETDQLVARKEQQGGRRVGGHRQVVRRERAQGTPFRDRSRERPEVGRRLGQVEVVPGRRAPRQQVGDGRPGATGRR